MRNFRQSRRELEALPFATDACGELATRVEAERRCDTLVDAPSRNMLADGRLASELGPLPISERALEGLSRLLTPGGTGYLTECPPFPARDVRQPWRYSFGDTSVQVVK